MTLGISPHHMLQSPSPRAVSCSPTLSADANLAIQQQQDFMQKVLHQQKALTTGLLKQNKTLCRSVNRFKAIIETNHLHKESRDDGEPSEPLDEAFSQEGQTLLGIPKKRWPLYSVAPRLAFSSAMKRIASYSMQ